MVLDPPSRYLKAQVDKAHTPYTHHEGIHTTINLIMYDIKIIGREVIVCEVTQVVSTNRIETDIPNLKFIVYILATHVTTLNVIMSNVNRTTTHMVTISE